MNALHLGESISVWLDTEVMPDFPKLSEDLPTDVCIVGGGIAGLTTAYLLMKEGKSVCLLEGFELGSGQSGRTTAHFVSAIDDRYFELEKFHGENGARLVAESHTAAIRKLEQIVREENIDCDLERLEGYLFAQGDERANVLDDEFKAARRAGLSDVELVEKAPLNFFDTGPCLRFTDQVEIHPVKYMSALARILQKGGGKIFTNTHVKKVTGGGEAVVETSDGFKVQCESIVVATNTPINDLFAIHTKQAPYRTYVTAFTIPKGSVPKALFWDTLDPYHYIRIQSGAADLAHDFLIVGGEDHKTGQEDHPESRYVKLEAWTRERFPMAGEVAYRWSGQVMEPVDGLAFLGRNPMDRDNVYIITGDSGNGMTHCTIGAMLISDQIMGRDNPWEQLYNPSRTSLRAMPEFFRENGNVAVQYADWFVAKPKPDFADVAAGEGVVYRDGLKMVAAYKDEDGDVTRLSAACTHLLGVVQWNSAEKSWDCPCHGSRFDCYGRVIEGPASTDLKNLSVRISDETPKMTRDADSENRIEREPGPTDFY